MYKRIYSLILAIIVCFTSIYSTTITVYADSNPNYGLTGKKWEDLNVFEKVVCTAENIFSFTGNLLSTDALKAHTTLDDFIDYVGGNYTADSTVSDMTINDLKAMNETDADEWYKKYCTALDNMGVTINENGMKATDDALKQIRSWLDEKETPLYYVYRSYSPDNAKKSWFQNENAYNSFINLINKYNCLGIGVNGKYIFDFSDFKDSYFLVLSSYYPSYSYSPVYAVETEQRATFVFNNYDFTLSSEPVTDLGNSDCLLTSNTVKPVISNCGSSSYGEYYLFTKNTEYYRVYTSLLAYQQCKNGESEQNVYYTSNYYKTENIQESPITLDEMTNLYNGYDDICKNIIEYAKNNQNDDTAVIKKLDELIQAVYSAGSVPSGGSTDITVDTDMSETNSILNKILEEIKKIHDTPIDVGDSTIFNEWNTDIKNMILNPDININTTVGNMKDSFSDTVNMLKKKFPFSIPWDVYFLLSFLADTPETPVYEIPFKLENYGIDEVLVIDMERFSVVSKISRMLLTLLYMVALMQLTIKVLGIGKDK